MHDETEELRKFCGQAIETLGILAAQYTCHALLLKGALKAAIGVNEALLTVVSMIEMPTGRMKNLDALVESWEKLLEEVPGFESRLIYPWEGENFSTDFLNFEGAEETRKRIAIEKEYIGFMNTHIKLLNGMIDHATTLIDSLWESASFETLPDDKKLELKKAVQGWQNMAAFLVILN
jgi:hypothetical protein